jgi:hypothetical protein
MMMLMIDQVDGIRQGDKASVSVPNDDSCVILEVENRLQMIQAHLPAEEAFKLGKLLMEAATVISWNSVDGRLTKPKKSAAEPCECRCPSCESRRPKDG